jgi:GTPase SAR1 family protein
MKNSHQQFINTEQGEELAKKIGATGYFECSAKTREGINDLFVAATKASLIHGKPSVKKLFSFAKKTSKNKNKCCMFL